MSVTMSMAISAALALVFALIPLAPSADPIAVNAQLLVGESFRWLETEPTAPRVARSASFISYFWRLANAEVVVRGRLEKTDDGSLDFVIEELLKGQLQRDLFLDRNWDDSRPRLEVRKRNLAEGEELLLLLEVKFQEGRPHYEAHIGTGLSGIIQLKEEGVSTFGAGLYQICFEQKQDALPVADFLKETRRALKQASTLKGQLARLDEAAPYDEESRPFSWRSIGKLRTAEALAHIKARIFDGGVEEWGDSDRLYAVRSLVWFGRAESYSVLEEVWQKSEENPQSQEAFAMVQSSLSILPYAPDIDLQGALAFVERVKQMKLSSRVGEQLRKVGVYLEQRQQLAADTKRVKLRIPVKRGPASRKKNSNPPR